MKQHITVDQLNELSPIKVDILTKWYMDKRYDDLGTQPVLSIGQMIEFLGIEYHHAISEYGSIDWVKAEEVCDALWESCKEVLEK